MSKQNNGQKKPLNKGNLLGRKVGSDNDLLDLRNVKNKQVGRHSSKHVVNLKEVTKRPPVKRRSNSQNIKYFVQFFIGPASSLLKKMGYFISFIPQEIKAWLREKKLNRTLKKQTIDSQPSFSLVESKQGVLSQSLESGKNKLSRLSERQNSFTQSLNSKISDGKQALKEKANSFSAISILPTGWHRSVLSFVFVSLIIILPVQAFSAYQNADQIRDNVTTNAFQAFVELTAAKEALANFEFNNAENQFNQAIIHFENAQAEIEKVGFVLESALSIAPLEQSFDDGKLAIEAGHAIARAGERLTNAVNNLQQSGLPMSERIVAVKNNIELALEDIIQAHVYISKINESAIPAEYHQTFVELRQSLPAIESGLRETLTLTDPILSVLGHGTMRRYLVMFQNNNEIRPTGGFLGSFALVDVNQGQITNISVPGGGTYDLKGQLKAKVLSPLPLHLINPVWQFQDANWFPDFPRSAQKIIWFYNQSGGSTVDGVIAINASLLEDFLEITGPIQMAKYDKILTAENVLFETQKAVELEYDKEENRPKQLISDLTPILLEKLAAKQSNNPMELFSVIAKALIEKNVLVYTEEQDIQRQIVDLGFAGEIKEATNDFVMVVNTNIAGGKTDGVIHQNIDIKTDIQEDGSIINTLTLARTHTGEPGAIFSGINNVDYLRIYAPKGSELIAAHGFSPPAEELFKPSPEGHSLDKDLEEVEQVVGIHPSGTRVSNQFDKTVFGNWVQVEPQEQVITQFIYSLPFKVDDLNDYSYNLLVQKQPGTKNSNVRWILNSPGEKQQIVGPVHLDIDQNLQIDLNK